jgi:hypothetical protein
MTTSTRGRRNALGRANARAHVVRTARQPAPAGAVAELDAKESLLGHAHRAMRVAGNRMVQRRHLLPAPTVDDDVDVGAHARGHCGIAYERDARDAQHARLVERGGITAAEDALVFRLSVACGHDVAADHRVTEGKSLVCGQRRFDEDCTPRKIAHRRLAAEHIGVELPLFDPHPAPAHQQIRTRAGEHER